MKDPCCLSIGFLPINGVWRISLPLISKYWKNKSSNSRLTESENDLFLKNGQRQLFEAEIRTYAPAAEFWQFVRCTPENRGNSVGASLFKLATRTSVIQKNTLGGNFIFMYILGGKNFHRWKHFSSAWRPRWFFFLSSVARLVVEESSLENASEARPLTEETSLEKNCSPRHLDRV